MSKQNQNFPATSIGRSQGARLQSTSSHEAHPLLSASPTTPEHGSFTTPTTVVNGNPRYVPYTPRQRVAPTATTTGTTVHPSSPQGYQGDATSKLQLMNMKAAAQSIGLDTGTVGWAMLEKLVLENDQGEEWAEIWNVVTSGKATLLLPLEQFSNEKFTPEYFRDHIVLYDGPSRRQAQIVTFSGLRGVLDEEILTFRSTLHTSSKIFQDLVNALSRAAALALLPPLPLPIQNMPSTQYPSFTMSLYSPSLPLPPKISIPGKPPLPPRPANRSISTTSNASSSRISNPFASLFGSSNVKIPTGSVSSSPPASLRSFDSSHDSSVEVSAFTIDRKIIRKDIARDINKTLKQEIKQALASVSSLMNNPVPGWVIERVHEFTVAWYPFVKPQPKKLVKGQSHSETQATNNGYVVNHLETVPEDVAEALQDFYMSLEEDMRADGSLHGASRRKERDEKESDLDDEKGRGRKGQEKMESETRVRDVMEAVETTICSLFYDRLFMQPHSDDSSHDEALSNRVSALNMLDLTLEHLDVNVGDAGQALDLVVKACGTKLTQLDLCRSPAEKAAILVAAHQIIVDGLSRLPPISLKPEQEPSSTTPLTARPPSKSPIVPLQIITPPVPIISLPSVSPDSPTSPLPLVGGFSSPPETAVAGKPSGASSLKKRPAPLSLTPETPLESTPVSGDVLLPMIIFSVVKANPPHLVSNLLYTQRFRNQSLGGEESYCLVNLLAVAEFLENVDLAALGLGDKAVSTADLTPLPLRSPKAAEMAPLPVGLPGGLRGRVEQQVDAIAGSAGKVIGGVVDSSFGILRSFMPSNLNPDEVTNPADGSSPKAGFGLLRRERGFSIASIAASLPGRGPKSVSGEESGQQLITVSRPASVRSRASSRSKINDDESQDDGSHETDGTDNNDESEVEDEEEDDGAPEVGDTRSIKSFESMMSERKGKRKSSAQTAMTRKSLSDRFAHMSALAGLKGSPPTSRRSSLLLPPAAATSARPSGSPASSRPSSPFRGTGFKLAPPVQRFVDCTPDDLRLSEVGELLRDYRRLVEGIRSVGGFDE